MESYSLKQEKRTQLTYKTIGLIFLAINVGFILFGLGVNLIFEYERNVFTDDNFTGLLFEAMWFITALVGTLMLLYAKIITSSDKDAEPALNHNERFLDNLETSKFLEASKIMRKRGFKVVYALDQNDAKENAFQLMRDLFPDFSEVEQRHLADKFLLNIKLIDDVDLLK